MKNDHFSYISLLVYFETTIHGAFLNALNAERVAFSLFHVNLQQCHVVYVNSPFVLTM